MSVRSCKYCNEPITFHMDDGIGKSYPVDPETEKPHDCVQRAKANSRNCNTCGQAIFWHSSMVGPKGGKIPLDVRTDKPHRCPAGSDADNQRGNEWNARNGSEFRS